MMGLVRLEWPYLLSAARIDSPSRTVRPKNTTAFNLTQTVCILLNYSSGVVEVC